MRIHILLFVFLFKTGFTQTPSVDPSWQLVFNDEFNIGTTPDPLNWRVQNYFDNGGAYDALMLQGNVTVQGGNLVLTAKRESNISCPAQYNSGNCSCTYFCNQSSYNYSGGWVESRNANFHYGFYEVRAKMDFRTAFFPAIWTLTGNPHYSEIDICEIIGTGDRRYNNPNNNLVMNNNMFTSNLHCGGEGGDPTKISKTKESYSELPINDYTQYHTYGLDWEPNRMSFYIDDQLIRVVNNPDNVLGSNWYEKFDVPMIFIFDAKVNKTIDQKYSSYHITPDFPASMYVDYFRYYQLKGNCSQIVTGPCYNFNTHTDDVKQVIDIGNSCYNTVPSGKNYVFRSSTYIELKDEFYVPVGSEFLADCDDFCRQTTFNTHNCNFIFTPCNYSFSGYVNDIKEIIQISGSSCNAIINPTDNVQMKATDFIDLKEGFSVPSGSTLDAKIVICQ